MRFTRFQNNIFTYFHVHFQENIIFLFPWLMSELLAVVLEVFAFYRLLNHSKVCSRLLNLITKASSHAHDTFTYKL